MNLEERFKVEVGRVRTFQEVLDSWNEVKILAKASTAAFEAACDLPIGPEREAALAKYDEEFEDGPSEPEVVETALAEIVPDLEQIEALRPMIEAAPESRRAQVTKLFDDFLKKKTWIMQEKILNILSTWQRLLLLLCLPKICIMPTKIMSPDTSE